MSHSELDALATQIQSNRRSFFGWLLGLSAAGAGGILSVPLVRFAIYPITGRTTETKWSDVGPASDFGSATAPAKPTPNGEQADALAKPHRPVQQTVRVEQLDGWRKEISDKVVYVTEDAAGQLRVLSAICPHLGCSVQWNTSKRQFVCPCHGASFAKDGTRLSGPSPRAMDTLDAAVRDGRLMVRYQYFRQSVPTKEVIG